MYSMWRRSDSNVQDKREFHVIMISKYSGESLCYYYIIMVPLLKGIWCILQQCTSQHGIHSKQRTYMYRSAQKNNLDNIHPISWCFYINIFKKLKLHSNIAYN